MRWPVRKGKQGGRPQRVDDRDSSSVRSWGRGQPRSCCALGTLFLGFHFVFLKAQPVSNRMELEESTACVVHVTL